MKEFTPLTFITPQMLSFTALDLGNIDDYAFRMTFQPGAIPTGLVTTIAGARYDYLTEADEIAGIETAFPANIPTITWRGLRAATAYTNYFLNSKTPVTQTITFAAAGTYTCYHYGTGSVTVSGASTGNGATVGTGSGTRSSAVTFTTASPGMTVTFTVAGSVNRVSVNTGPTPMPFVPTAGSAVGSSTEFGLSSNYVMLSEQQRSKINTQGTLKVVGSNLAAGVYVGVFSLVSLTSSSIDIFYSNPPVLKMYDGLGASSLLYVPLNDFLGEYEYIARWIKNGKRYFKFNGDTSSVNDYVGTWNASHVYFLTRSIPNCVFYIKSVEILNKAKSWV